MDGFLNTIDCIVLAGGKGTRLKNVISDIPKPMAPIRNTPFLEILLQNLYQAGIKRFLLATGFKSEVIEKHFTENPFPFQISYSIEKEPLGTGGAILQALKQTKSDRVLIVNGDTLFRLNVENFVQQAESFITNSCVLALKKITNSDRYGNVNLDKERITQFEEKVFRQEAFINSGVYLLDKKWFLTLNFPAQFSFEKDFLEVYAPKGKIFGIEQEGYFIDIGVPEDYQRAQIEIT